MQQVALQGFLCQIRITADERGDLIEEATPDDQDDIPGENLVHLLVQEKDHSTVNYGDDVNNGKKQVAQVEPR